MVLHAPVKSTAQGRDLGGEAGRDRAVRVGERGRGFADVATGKHTCAAGAEVRGNGAICPDMKIGGG